MENEKEWLKKGGVRQQRKYQTMAITANVAATAAVRGMGFSGSRGEKAEE